MTDEAMSPLHALLSQAQTGSAVCAVYVRFLQTSG
jgi:hypothetical protein